MRLRNEALLQAGVELGGIAWQHTFGNTDVMADTRTKLNVVLSRSETSPIDIINRIRCQMFEQDPARFSGE
ncbi:hypothetical protein ACQPXH_06925 [Nocardia sp. CA-135953]|uniref:hypothetical protein n=1 Tax=Nocardia sp. CA-135953 TaxID=3239978 RepID=UPI003D991993